MDPAALNLVSAPLDLSALLAGPGEAQVRALLLSLVGQELEVLFLDKGPEGVKLQLPSGGVLVAQGDLSYPEGTQLLVKVLPPAPGETAPRLQPLEARAPPPPPLLAPLLQGEGGLLLGRLLAPEPPAALAPLVALFQGLAAPEARTSASVAVPTPVSPPLGALAPGLPALAPELAAALESALSAELPPEPLPHLLARWLQTPPPAAPLAELPAPVIAALRPLLDAAKPSLPLGVSPPTPEPAPPPTLEPLPRAALEAAVAPWPGALQAQVREALLPRLPAHPLEALVQRWIQDQGLERRPPELPPPLRARLDTLPPGPREEVQRRLQSLLLDLPLPGNRGPAPASAGPTPLRIPNLEALPPDTLEALARALDLPPDAPAARIAEAFLARPSLPDRPPVARETDPWIATLPASVRERVVALLGDREAKETESMASPSTKPRPPAADVPPDLAPRIAAWPAVLREALGQVLPALLPHPAPRDLAEALWRWIQDLPAPEPEPGAGDTAPKLSSRMAAPRPPAPLPEAAERLLSRIVLPPEGKEALRAWLRGLLAPARTATPESTRPLEPGPRPESRDLPALPPTVRALPLEGALLQRLETRMQAEGPGAPAHPEPWEAWVSASLKTLADPKASPQEARFHALQGQDRTGYFEIPLPWDPHHGLQVWAEMDREGSDPRPPEVRRVLLGLHFSALGETRVGLESAGGALSVRIWAEDPGPIRALAPDLQRELETLAPRATLRIQPLPPNAPDPRSLAVGTAYQGLA